jgi:hypothetical protein
MDKNDIHPFLGVKEIDGKPYVVLFLEQDKGVVLVNETDSKEIYFGLEGEFDENSFEFLNPESDVRLHN